MKKMVMVLIVTLAIPVVLYAQNRISLSSSYKVCAQNTVYNLPSIPGSADYAVICVEGSDVPIRHVTPLLTPVGVPPNGVAHMQQRGSGEDHVAQRLA